ncbi:MAG TPA: TolC family protein [Gemmatimonadales bacterium]|nr:TolC family protein [Gemmatimonadales bacterium]
MTTSCSRRRLLVRPAAAIVLATATGVLGCGNPPGVSGVAGTAPAPHVFWTPPSGATSAARANLPATVPADLGARIQELQLIDVVDIALRNNSATDAAWAQARAAAAAYGSARGQYFPSLSLEASATTLKTAPFGGRVAAEQQYYGPTFTASWLLLDFGGRSGSIGQAREALLAADWTHNAVIQDVVLAAEQSYFIYIGTKALLAAQQTSLDEARTNLEAATQRHNVGLATIADVLQAQTALSRAQLVLESTEGALQTTRGALALSMGLPANVPYDIAPMPPGPVPLGIRDSVDSLIERATRERPALLAARATARQASARISSARGAALPSLVLGGTWQQIDFFNGSNTGGNGYLATIGLQIPIFNGGSQVYDVRAAKAAARAAADEVRGVEQQVVYEVFQSYYALRTATQQVRTSTDLLASATQSTEVALGRYKAGAGSLLDLLTAQAALAAARAQEIQSRFGWFVALAQLAHDTGILGLDGASPLRVRTDSTDTPR